MARDRGRSSFRTTHWGLVRAACTPDSPEREPALAALCETYWFPLYAFVRHSGYTSEDSRDLTQAFFARLIEKGDLDQADPYRGRFRSFLLASLKHFLANEWNARHAQKRGGGRPHVALMFQDGEQRYQMESPHNSTPDRIYERRWALAVLENAMRRLEAAYAHSGRRHLFDRLKPCLVEGQGPGYESTAKELHVSEGSVRVAVHRLRRQFSSQLRETIAETVQHPEDVDDELRYLLEVLSR